MERLEKIEEKKEEQSLMYNLASQMLFVRTRHNSL
jgi:hypothetical protein